LVPRHNRKTRHYSARSRVASSLPCACQNQRHIIRLLVGTDPIIYGSGYNFADSRQRQVPVLLHQFDEPSLAEFAKVVFWLGHPVAVREKNLAAMKMHFSFVIAYLPA